MQINVIKHPWSKIYSHAHSMSHTLALELTKNLVFGLTGIGAQNRVQTGQGTLIRNYCVFDNRLEIINFVYWVQTLIFSEINFPNL